MTLLLKSLSFTIRSMTLNKVPFMILERDWSPRTVGHSRRFDDLDIKVHELYHSVDDLEQSSIYDLEMDWSARSVRHLRTRTASILVTPLSYSLSLETSFSNKKSEDFFPSCFFLGWKHLFYLVQNSDSHTKRNHIHRILFRIRKMR